jgi:hypothetical protein
MIRKHAVEIYACITSTAYLALFTILAISLMSERAAEPPVWLIIAIFAAAVLFNLAWWQADQVRHKSQVSP